MTRCMAAFTLLLGGGVVLAAQSAPQAPSPRFSAGTELVEVYATVTDAKGELVTGLRQDDFDIFENSARQEVSAFAAGEFALTVALGIDRSWSMAGEPLRLARQASQSFLRGLKPGDRSMVVAISAAVDGSPRAESRHRGPRSLEHDGAARRDHRRAGSACSGARAPGADPVFRRHRSLQHRVGGAGRRPRPAQQRADLSDRVRQDTPPVSRGTGGADRRPLVPPA